MILLEAICFNCKHYNEEKGICKAFPKVIPEEILIGNNDHSKPLPDQGNDIVFEPVNKKERAA